MSRAIKGKKSTDTLRESEERYRRLAESANAILWEFDIARDRWTYVAPQTTEILGHSPEDWLDYHFWIEHLHPDDREWAAKYCSDCTARGEEHVFEYRFRKKDGSYAWLRDLVLRRTLNWSFFAWTFGQDEPV